jgi:hypothetical protein
MVRIIEKNFINKDRENLIIELKRNPHCFSYFPAHWRSNREIVMEAIHYFPHNYYYITDELKKDRIIGLKVVTANAMLFCSLSDELKGDKEIAMIALEHNPCNLKYISLELKKDEDLFFLIVQKNYYGVTYFSEEILNNRNVIEKAMKMNSNIFGYLRSPLIYEKEFLLSVIQKFNIPLKNIPIKMRNDMDIIRTAVTRDYKNFIQIPKTLYENHNFVFQLYLHNKAIKIFLSNTRHERILDRFNLLLLIKKKNNEPYNIFHTTDLCFYIMTFL